MKKLSLFFFLILSIIEVSACKCVINPFAENYLKADVAGVIKILKVYDEDEQQRTYKADVEFEKVYKGTKFATLHIRGLIGKSSSAACEIDIEPNERYLVLLSGSGNKYTMTSCTPKSKLKDQPTRVENEQLENLGKALAYLDNNKFKFMGLKFASYYDETHEVNNKSDLSKINKFRPKQPFAIYKATVNELSRIEKISPIISFKSQDKTVEDIMKRKLTIELPMYRSDSKQKEYLLLFFYNKKNINIQDREIISEYWW